LSKEELIQYIGMTFDVFTFKEIEAILPKTTPKN